jgi:DNA ligase-1
LERKELLNKFFSHFSSPYYSLSPIIPFSNWKSLELIKSNSLNNHIEGLMIKRSSSLYEKGRVSNSWYKWKRKPFIIDFILIYAQRGHGKRSSFYSDFTFGCWVDNNFKKLVPIGKAYSGFTNDELDKLDRWVRSNTVEKFGPVRALKPGLVIEVAFDNINFSERHKSGVALRFPRFNRIRWDKPIEDVCILEDIESLIN